MIAGDDKDRVREIQSVFQLIKGKVLVITVTIKWIQGEEELKLHAGKET